MSAKRDRRVTLALKWYHLDRLSVDEIRDRFEQAGIEPNTGGAFSRSTIRDYLSEATAGEIVEQVAQKQADARVQIGERYERLYQRARDAEFKATTDEPITGLRPQSDFNTTPNPITVQDWTRITPDDDRYPAWATPNQDVVIEFTSGAREVAPGAAYYVPDPAGEPQYEQALVGLERDQPDEKVRSFRREEQAEHLAEKADVLGVSEENVNLNMSGEVGHDHAVEINHVSAAELFGDEDTDESEHGNGSEETRAEE
jgi:hypothetical protein